MKLQRTHYLLWAGLLLASAGTAFSQTTYTWDGTAADGLWTGLNWTTGGTPAQATVPTSTGTAPTSHGYSGGDTFIINNGDTISEDLQVIQVGGVFELSGGSTLELLPFSGTRTLSGLNLGQGSPTVATITDSTLRVQRSNGSGAALRILGPSNLVVTNSTVEAGGEDAFVGSFWIEGGSSLTVDATSVVTVEDELAFFTTSTGSLSGTISAGALRADTGGNSQITFVEGSITLTDPNPARSSDAFDGDVNWTGAVGSSTMTSTNVSGTFTDEQLATKVGQGFLSLDGTTVRPPFPSGADWAISANVTALNGYLASGPGVSGGRHFSVAVGATQVVSLVAFVDTDLDGMTDTYETAFGLNPGVANLVGDDLDADGRDDLDEYADGTHPNDDDTDGDLLLDGEEFTNGTDPTLTDTDGDGYDDFIEVNQGGDPLDPAVGPKELDGLYVDFSSNFAMHDNGSTPFYQPYIAADQNAGGDLARSEVYDVFGFGVGTTSVTLTVGMADSFGDLAGPVDAAMRMIDRPAQLVTYDGANTALMRDWIGINSQASGGVSGATELSLEFAGLPAGEYRLRTYHHDLIDKESEFEIEVEDNYSGGIGTPVNLGVFEVSSSGGETPTALAVAEVPANLPSTREVVISSDGTNPVRVTFIQAEDTVGAYAASRESFMVMNGFELTPTTDTDGDRMPDVYEDAIAGLNSGVDDAALSADADTLTNLREYNLGTDPEDPDSDDDGLNDDLETITDFFTSAADTGTDPLVADEDCDGLNDGDELTAGTDQYDYDSDDDLFGDGIDTDPLNAAVIPSFGSAAFQATFEAPNNTLPLTADVGTLTVNSGATGISVVPTSAADPFLGGFAVLADGVTAGEAVNTTWDLANPVDLTGGNTVAVSFHYVHRRSNGATKDHYVTGFDQLGREVFRFVLGELSAFPTDGNGVADPNNDRQKPGYGTENGLFAFAPSTEMADGLVPNTFYWGLDGSTASLNVNQDVQVQMLIDENGMTIGLRRQNGLLSYIKNLPLWAEANSYADISHIVFRGESGAAGGYFDNIFVEGVAAPVVAGDIALTNADFVSGAPNTVTADIASTVNVDIYESATAEPGSWGVATLTNVAPGLGVVIDADASAVETYYIAVIAGESAP